LLHEQAAPLARESGAFACHTKVLTRAAACDDVHRRQLRPIQPGYIPDMEQVGESVFRHLDGKRFDLAGPYRRDAMAYGCQRKAADPIEQTAQLDHHGHRMFIP